MTDKERELLEYINDCLDRDGVPPSMRQIAAALGIKSTATVSARLKSLENQGLIKREENRPRSSVPVKSAASAPRTVRIPIIHSGALRSPLLSVANYDGYFDFPLMNRAYETHRLIALRAPADISPGILRGDLATVLLGGHEPYRSDAAPETGGRHTHRKPAGVCFGLSGGRAVLVCSPDDTDTVTVLGRVISVTRYY